MRFKYVLATLFILCNAVVHSQAKTDLEKITELFSKSYKAYMNPVVFKLNIDYKLFTTYKSNVVSEQYTSVVIKNRNEYYSKIDKTEFISLKKLFIKIDNESKLMQVNDDVSDAEINDVYDLKGFLRHFNKFKLTEEGDYFVCSMTSPEVTSIPYGQIIVFIHKRNYNLNKIIFINPLDKCFKFIFFNFYN